MDDDRGLPVVVGGKKNGANFIEENQIRQLTLDGHSVEAISAHLLIEQSCVASVVKDFEERREEYEQKMADGVGKVVSANDGGPVPEPSLDEVFSGEDSPPQETDPLG